MKEKPTENERDKKFNKIRNKIVGTIKEYEDMKSYSFIKFKEKYSNTNYEFIKTPLLKAKICYYICYFKLPVALFN